jgi:hypothetical protein
VAAVTVAAVATVVAAAMAAAADSLAAAVAADVTAAEVAVADAAAGSAPGSFSALAAWLARAAPAAACPGARAACAESDQPTGRLLWSAEDSRSAPNSRRLCHRHTPNSFPPASRPRGSDPLAAASFVTGRYPGGRGGERSVHATPSTATSRAELQASLMAFRPW